MRSNILQATFRASGRYHAPDHLRTESAVPNALGLIDGPKYRTPGDVRGGIQLSTAALTQVGTGTVRTWSPFPIMSAITQCSSRCWRLSTANPATSCPSKTTPQQNRNYGVVTFCRADWPSPRCQGGACLVPQSAIFPSAHHAFSLPSPAGFLPPGRD